MPPSCSCALIWSILAPENLSAVAAKAMADEPGEVFVSAISCAEIACAVEQGRLVLDRHWKLWFRHFVEANGWQIADVDLKIAEESYSLPECRLRDPADRIIIATARIHRCPLVTADRRMLEYPHVDTVW